MGIENVGLIQACFAHRLNTELQELNEINEVEVDDWW